MAPTSSSLALAFFSLLFLSTLSPSIEAYNGGFRVDLIHRDSPRSPFYNPEETPYQRISNALQRSRTRISRFEFTSSDSSAPESEVSMNHGEYLMNISIGTPPFEIVAIADTGSDLIWTQCKPCDSCYQQDRPMFDPNSSSTYKDLSCTTQACTNLPQASCGGDSGQDGACLYSYSYGDQSYSKGNLATDTFTLSSSSGRPISFPKSIFGCGHDDAGTFSNKGSGIVGLGGGPLSLVSQLGTIIDQKFSYCLVPFYSKTGNSSTLFFGPDSAPKGSGFGSTPLLSKDSDTYYFLELESFSVGNTTIEFGSSSTMDSDTRSGNIIIDSGTTLTLIPQDVFDSLSSAVDESVGATKTDDPSGQLSMCYTADSFNNPPNIVAHFAGGANLELDPLGTFIAVSDSVLCFAFSAIDSSSGTPSIIGNLAQMNHEVAYDLKGKTVSFKKTDCTKV